ncbi:MAG TPA: C40 family peptidase [Cyclobacteriaceae bacterium]|jgi:hypothetical protein|nr:C40 family peptidase [Cyclobacteriaceae bacterium]
MEIIDYGVCRQALVPVRINPDDLTEQVTQLLFGDHYEVLTITENKKWVRIRIHADQYEGWIDMKQHHPITQEYFDQINFANFKITTDIATGILYKKSALTILMGSIVPISNSELFKVEEQLAFNGESKSLGQKRDIEFLKAIALKYCNAPYQWGGKSPFGIDCSGFVQMVFKISGYSLPRDAAQQIRSGKTVKNIEASMPGDLAFFHNAEGKIVHVGIILSDEKIIHASGQVRIDHINEEGILHSDSKIYTHQLSEIRRILNS